MTRKGNYHFIDITGQRFGRWLVLSRAENLISHDRKVNIVAWLCRCDCGTERVVCGRNLRRELSRSVSCGCFGRERTSEMCKSRVKENNPRYIIDRDDSGLRRIFTSYKHNAKRDKRSFELSIEQFSEIIRSPCYYCGKPPLNSWADATVKGQRFVYNGIDRVDNSIGYVLNNCVPCCRMCNLSKKDHTKDEFLSWIEQVHEHQLGKLHV